MGDLLWPMEIRINSLNASALYVSTNNQGDGLPSTGRYGVVGGAYSQKYYGGLEDTEGAPATGTRYLAIQSADVSDGIVQFQVTVRENAPAPLGFDASALGGASSNSVYFDLENDEYAFYSVEVPETVSGQTFLGWLLEVSSNNGSLSLRAASGSVPLNAASGDTTGYTSSRLYLGTVFRSEGNYARSLSPGTWYVQLEAYGNTTGTVTSQALFADAMNFDTQLNSNGLSHSVTATSSSGEKHFYQIDVPSMLGGEPVLAWVLELEELSGSASMQVSRDVLPIQYGIETFGSGDDILLLDRSQISAGTYYVAVDGSSSSEYRLTSRGITRADLIAEWTMPAVGEAVATPGLTTPVFGDSGYDEFGNPLPNDLGRDIAEGGYHLYSVDVPEGNGGLLRIQLDAISGNPDLYVRVGEIGTDQSDYDFGLTQSGQTQYGNFVTTDGFFEQQLETGTYYIAVRAASGSNARYRMQLSTGVIQDLVLDGGSVTNLSMAAGDWRYLRVTIPENPPVSWEIDFDTIQGDVEMYIRDTVPPGTAAEETVYWNTIHSWVDEAKNQGTYEDYYTPTTVSLSTPQIRPGTVYYLGFRATVDSVLEVSSAVPGGYEAAPALVGFYGGAVNGELAPGEVRRFKVNSPAEATRWRHQSTHSNEVDFYLEQGSFPALLSGDDYYARNETNSSYSRSLTSNNSSSSWPWIAGESFYVAFENTGTSTEPFSFSMDGRNRDTEDEDRDSLPDYWELDFLGTTGYSVDFEDGDARPLLLEYFLGTNPSVADVSDLRAVSDGSNFEFIFRKRTQTDLVEFSIERAHSLNGTWDRVSPTLDLIVDEGATQLWKATVPKAMGEASGFFKIVVSPKIEP